MEPLRDIPDEVCRGIRLVLTDIDDTLTLSGRLAARTYDALERLQAVGITIIPVTAAPAGWCDQIARMWPVDGVIGENGGLYFVFDHDHQRMRRRFWLDEAELSANRERLAELAASVMREFPEAEVPAENAYREITVALEFASRTEHRRRGPAAAECLRRKGAGATLNSLWVIGWLGEFDKLAMTRTMLTEMFGLDAAAERDSVLYVGDSVNDEPMFRHFPNSVGVSTVRQFAADMAALPRWITEGPGGTGFVEIADAVLRSRHH